MSLVEIFWNWFTNVNWLRAWHLTISIFPLIDRFLLDQFKSMVLRKAIFDVTLRAYLSFGLVDKKLPQILTVSLGLITTVLSKYVDEISFKVNRSLVSCLHNRSISVLSALSKKHFWFDAVLLLKESYDSIKETVRRSKRRRRRFPFSYKLEQLIMRWNVKLYRIIPTTI